VTRRTKLCFAGGTLAAIVAGVWLAVSGSPRPPSFFPVEEWEVFESGLSNETPRAYALFSVHRDVGSLLVDCERSGVRWRRREFDSPLQYVLTPEAPIEGIRSLRLMAGRSFESGKKFTPFERIQAQERAVGWTVVAVSYQPNLRSTLQHLVQHRLFPLVGARPSSKRSNRAILGQDWSRWQATRRR